MKSIPINFQRDMMAIALIAQHAIEQVDEGISQDEIRHQQKKLAKRFQKNAEPIVESMFQSIVSESRDQFIKGMTIIEDKNHPNLSDNLGVICAISDTSTSPRVRKVTSNLYKTAQQMLKDEAFPKPQSDANKIAESLLKMIKIQPHE